MPDRREYYLTPEGEAKLRAELEELTGPKRQDLAARLRFAIKQGDLSENADYIAAKEEQAFLEGRIQEIQAVLRDATIVDGTDSSDTVQVGSTVTVRRDGGPEESYQLVGFSEAAPRDGKISNESPIGRALLGRKVGDTATVETPAGQVEVEVLSIE